MSAETDQSPDASPSGLKVNLLGNSVKGQGVRRLNKLPLMMIFGGGAIVMVVVFATLYQKSHHPTSAVAAGERTHEKASAALLPNAFDNTPTTGEIAPVAPPPAAADVPADVTGAPAGANGGRTPVSSANRSPMPLTDQHRSPANTAWDNYYKNLMQVQAREQSQAERAIEAPTAVGSSSQKRAGAGLDSAGAAHGAGSSSTDSASQRLAALGAGGGSASREGAPDQNMQAEKSDFLTQKPDTADYLAHGRETPQTDYDVKAGTVIPAVMISGLNSDLPGQIIAEITENVYDTATGRYLIIPQGSRLTGNYDSKVAYGQSRALTAWHRIIYPDASTADLDVMPGADQSGYSGFHDLVDNHYLRLVGSAVMLSFFSAGIQLSQPQPTTSSTGTSTQYTNQQIIAGALGQQLGELGTEITRKNLQIQPTIEIRPGYLFNVMVNKDLVLSPWGVAQ